MMANILMLEFFVLAVQVAAGQGCDPTGAEGGGTEARPPPACGSEELHPTRCRG